MKQIRKLKRATWIIFSVIASVVVLSFGVMSAAAYRTAAAKAPQRREWRKHAFFSYHSRKRLKVQRLCRTIAAY